MIFDFFKKFFGTKNDFDEDDEDFLNLVIDGTFDDEPCQGSLELGDHCFGCFYEEVHVGKGRGNYD